MLYDFTRLSNKIKDIYGNNENFALEMRISVSTISRKMNGKTPWKGHEMEKAIILLNVPLEEMPEFFFKRKVEILQPKGFKEIV